VDRHRERAHTTVTAAVQRRARYGRHANWEFKPAGGHAREIRHLAIVRRRHRECHVGRAHRRRQIHCDRSGTTDCRRLSVGNGRHDASRELRGIVPGVGRGRRNRGQRNAHIGEDRRENDFAIVISMNSGRG